MDICKACLEFFSEMDSDDEKLLRAIKDSDKIQNVLKESEETVIGVAEVEEGERGPFRVKVKQHEEVEDLRTLGRIINPTAYNLAVKQFLCHMFMAATAAITNGIHLYVWMDADYQEIEVLEKHGRKHTVPRRAMDGKMKTRSFTYLQYQGVNIATSPVMCGLRLMDHAIWQDLGLDYVMKSFPDINEGKEIRCLLLQPFKMLKQPCRSRFFTLLNHHTSQKSKDDNVTLGHFLTKVYTEEEVQQWFPDILELRSYEQWKSGQTLQQDWMETPFHWKYVKIGYMGLEPKRSTFGSAGWDIHTPEEINLKAGEVTTITLDLKLSIPLEYYGKFFTRSSMAAANVQVMGGVIDADYEGPIKLFLSNHGQEDLTVAAGVSLANLCILPRPDVKFIMEEIKETGKHLGFGSTNQDGKPTVEPRETKRKQDN